MNCKTLPYSLQHAAIGASCILALAACSGGTSTSPAPAPQVRTVTVPLGEHGGSITLTEQAGTYRRNGAVIASGATVEGSNSQTYRLTLETGRWTAEYVPPDPSAVALGTSGEAILVARKEDGTYLAGETPIESGGTFTGSNGSQYRLTLSQGNWQAMYLAPDPVQVMLGVSGGTVTVRRNEDGSYTTGTAAFESGGDPITGSNGSQYRLTLRANQWQVEYVPLPDATVTLGASGGTVTVRRNEDGSYRTANAPLQSGDLISAPNGSQYRLTLIGNDGNAWRAAYVAPEPGRVELGGSGRFVTVTRNEDGFYTTGTERFHSGDLVPDGRGNLYRFVLVGSEWSADYVPQNVDVRLGNSQITVRLTREEGGEHWLGRTRVTSGYIHPATNGSRYRFTLEDGRWTAVFVPDSIQVPAGDSGKSLVLLRLEDGTYVLNQRTVESGQTVTLEGNEYRLTQTGNAWTARFIAGTVTVDLPTGRTIELTKREDGTYVRDDGRVVRSGSTHTFYGVRYRLTLGANGWRAVRRVTIPSSGGGSPSTPSPQPSTTDEIETKLPTAATDFDLRDAGSDTANTRGTHLYVGPDMNRQSYAVEELLGRGIVRKRPAYVEVAKQEIEAIAARVGRFRGLYEIDKDSLTNSEFGLAALWEQAETAFQKIPGLESRTLSRPWGRSSNIGTGHISDVIEDLGTVADNLASVEAFVDAYGSANRSNFTLPRSKLAFGSTGDTRFGAYANRKSSDGTWDTGYFAYSRAEAPSNLRAQGKATYSGDTVAVLPSGDTDTPETYSGRITLTATFSTGIVAGEITDLEDDDGGSLVHDSRSVASVQLPNATLSSSSTGMFESTSGQATLAPGPSLNRVNATFEGQLVDGDSEAFGRWSLTLTSSTLQGAFGTTKSTSGSTSTAVVDTPWHQGRPFRVLEGHLYHDLYGARKRSRPRSLGKTSTRAAAPVSRR